MHKKKVKAIHALNWMYGNICTKKCHLSPEKQKACYDKMKEIIKGHEDFMIAYKMFIWVMRKKHKICDLSDSEFYKKDYNFWRNHDCPICRRLGL